jgi:hypothetical protein
MASEGKICRAVIDRHDVMKNQVTEAVSGGLGNSADRKQLEEIRKTIHKIFESHTSGLIDVISKQFSG